MNSSRIVWLSICCTFVIWRLLVPFHVEWTWTAFHKDMAHIFWGCLITYSLMRRKEVLLIVGDQTQVFERLSRDWLLFGAAWVIAIFELYAAIFKIGGI